jgi:hypothetical protein
MHSPRMRSGPATPPIHSAALINEHLKAQHVAEDRPPSSGRSGVKAWCPEQNKRLACFRTGILGVTMAAEPAAMPAYASQLPNAVRQARPAAFAWPQCCALPAD